ncbi:MAG: GH92 family glycosyl hydrolase [Bacteroidota bacterium]
MLAYLCFSLEVFSQQVVEYVNPFIGTSNFGATHPGAQFPHGLASVVPFNAAFKKGAENVFEKDAEWHSRPYVHENQFLTGFSHVNLSGVGCPDLGSILLMPTHGPLQLDPEQYGSTFSEQKAEPGYYSTQIDKYDIQAEVSSSLRTGISRYSFPAGESHIILNLGLGLTNESGAMLRIVNQQEVEGFKMIGTFCYHPEDVRPVYFVMRLSKAADSFGGWKKMPAYQGVEADWVGYNDTVKPYPAFQQELAGDNVGAYFSYNSVDKEQITARVGISYVSIEQARKNLDAEQAEMDFEAVRRAAAQAWNRLLSRIEVEGTETDKTIFYTALYHVLTHPSVLQDVDGQYPLMGKAGFGQTDGNRYSIFSLWDTYRNVHPLLSLVYPEIQSEMVNSMVAMSAESGWLPKWELLSMETGVMVGDPAAPVITDTYLRGIRNFEVEKAYAAMRKAALAKEADNPLRPDHDAYLKLGYIPMDNEDKWGGSVATALEYYISDWNIAQLAKSLGKESDFQMFQQRSLNYRKYLDPESGMLRPRHADGRWYAPFDPEAGKNFEPVIGYVEGNAWQYRFYVPHDIRGLIEGLGGEKAFAQALDQCFETDNYNMANEPDITYPFLYNYVKGQEWKTQQRVQELIQTYYTNTPGGIPGNDDTGTLSAWLVYAMMGFYPVCPGDMDYALFSPAFQKITIHLNQDYYPGERFEIRSHQQNPEDIIRTFSLNDTRHKSFFLNHHSLVKGGKLDIHYQRAKK